MTPQELMQMLEQRLSLLGMKIQPSVAKIIVSLSQGLPGYTHLMGQAAARSAIKARTLEIGSIQLADAVSTAIAKSDETVKSSYSKATLSTKPTNQYRQALLACALAKIDDRGYFNAAAVKYPFSEIMGRKMEIPAFARHLNEFCDESRGPMLTKEGRAKNYQYRFADPLMRPYVVIRGLGDGLITDKHLGND